MSSPIPHVALTGSCSIIHEKTLYTYSANAFQSLPLGNGSEWSQLKGGVAVTGGACVKAPAPGTPNALWIVGGAAANKADYPGLQYFSFADQLWHTVEPVVKVTQNRQGHAAVYLPDSESILVYAGSQDDPAQFSIQTFSVSIKEPFNVLSFAGKPIPVNRPLLLPWNSSSAITLGGKPGNKDIFMFNPASRGWSQYPTALVQAPKSVDAEQATLIQAKDGSKVLQLYDLSVTPNLVSRVVLQDSSGRPARPGITVGQQVQEPRPGTSRRDLTLTDWPSYNDSAAPMYTRSGFSLAPPDQSAPGLVALSGGNKQHPVALFNQQQNKWLDSTKFFGLSDSNEQAFLGTTTSAPPSSTSTASATPVASTSAAAVSDDNHPQTSVVLGAVLGSILGFIALLILALLCLRRKRKAKAAQQAETDGEKPRLSFADRGDPYMMEAPGVPRGPADAHSSMAIMGGYAGHNRGSESRGSVSSTARLVPKKSYPAYNEVVEMGIIKEKSIDPTRLGAVAGNNTSQTQGGSPGLLALPKRSSGWSRYFSGGTDVAAAAGSKNMRKSGLSRKSLRSSRASSSYTLRSHQSVHDCTSHGPTQIPPLEMGGTFESSNVSDAIHSTPLNSPGHDISEFGATRPSTMSSFLSSNPPSTLGDTIFTAPYETDEKNRWSPVTKASDWTSRSGIRDTATSSIYAPTDVPPRQPLSVGGFGAMPSSSSDRPITRGQQPTPRDTPSDSASQPSISAFPFPQKPAASSRTPAPDPFPKPGLSLMPPQRDSNASNVSNVTTWPAPSALAEGNNDHRRILDPEDAASSIAQPKPTLEMHSGPSQRSLASSTQANPFLNKADLHSSDSSSVLPSGNFGPSKPAAAAAAAGSRSDGSRTAAQSVNSTARNDNATLRPAPAQRASIVEIDDSEDDDDDYEEPIVVTASSGPAPTAVTAIPVPASTAMQYTVKKPLKQGGATDMSWVSLK